ncbi:Hypothetical_protein [Hexamita inflata]|uniref:Hypothetical_protein n=1 Tax=Hexamita inflata TaxID=28002 RepID=A0AA86PFU6_9EUKA|nr:Hypothetical protein HINF_LOCUS22870 [Hexamita inflata]CAI9948566.1 Hypothetical protein HINF_LOCUS36211 [Hexamita inflata]
MQKIAQKYELRVDKNYPLAQEYSYINRKQYKSYKQMKVGDLDYNWDLLENINNMYDGMIEQENLLKVKDQTVTVNGHISMYSPRKPKSQIQKELKQSNRYLKADIPTLPPPKIKQQQRPLSPLFRITSFQ